MSGYSEGYFFHGPWVSPLADHTRVAHHPSVKTEGRFKALAGKWKQVGAGILLMMLLIGGALWFKEKWLSLMRGLSGTSRDVPPYSIADWQHRLRGVNVVGLKRAGFDDRRVRQIKEIFRVLFRKGRNLSLAIKEIGAGKKISPNGVALLEFIKSSKRGVCLSS
ncbi:MAG: hypothetical protein O7B35_03720 [Deltaproteobacteria bacterium]|nr:hypothetical protein [Deltaproteobacteria bacterium]